MAMNQPTNDDRRLKPVDPPSREIATNDLFDDARIKLIHETVAKGAPDDVFAAMIDIARTRGLDPMAKQIGVAQFDRNSGYQIYMPIDGYRAVAGDHPDFAGKDKPEYGPVVGKTPMGKPYPEWCSITVYRLVQGHRMPFTAEVWWEEFYGGERNRSWNKMPRVMLAKVAEAHALRMAFTRSLSGTYTPDEMDQASVEVQGRVVSHSTGEIQTPPQTRQDRPRQPIQAEVVESPGDGQQSLENGTEQRDKANARAHAVAQGLFGKTGHDVLHVMAELAWGYDSLTQCTADDLNDMAKRLETKSPEDLDAWYVKWIAPRMPETVDDKEADTDE